MPVGGPDHGAEPAGTGLFGYRKVSYFAQTLRRKAATLARTHMKVSGDRMVQHDRIPDIDADPHGGGTTLSAMPASCDRSTIDRRMNRIEMHQIRPRP